MLAHWADIVLILIGLWLLSVFTAVLEPITFTVHLEDMDVMGQPVQ